MYVVWLRFGFPDAGSMQLGQHSQTHRNVQPLCKPCAKIALQLWRLGKGLALVVA